MIRFGKLTALSGYGVENSDKMTMRYQGKNPSLRANYSVDASYDKGSLEAQFFIANQADFTVKLNAQGPDQVELSSKGNQKDPSPVLSAAAQKVFLTDAQAILKKANDLSRFLSSKSRNKLDPQLQRLVIENKLQA